MSNSLICFPNLAMPMEPAQTMVTEAQAVDILLGHESSEYIDAFESSSININPCDSSVKPSPVVVPPRPITFVIPALIQGQPSKKFLSALLDTGSDGSFIHARCIPLGVKLTPVEPRAVVGLHQSQQYTLLASHLGEHCSSRA